MNHTRELNDFGKVFLIFITSCLLYLFSHTVLVQYNSSLRSKADALITRTQNVTDENTRERNRVITLIEELGMEIEQPE